MRTYPLAESFSSSVRARLGSILLGILISGLALWWLLRQIDLSQVRPVVAQARLWWLLPALALYFVSLSVRAWRWRWLLMGVRPMSWRQLWPVTAIGYAGNVLLPARLGELLKAVVLSRRGVHISAALGSIATERVLDGLTTVGILLLAGRSLPATAPIWLTAAIRTAGVFFAGGLLLLWLALAFRPVVSAFLGRWADRFPWLTRPLRWFDRFLDGLAVLRSPGFLARSVGITLLGWLITVIEYWCVLYAFRLRLNPLAAAFSVSAIGLSTAVPAAPGYVGTQELAGVTILGLYGVPGEVAFSASVTFHLIEMLPIALVGLVLIWREGLRGATRLQV